jgi:hypothetical protein
MSGFATTVIQVLASAQADDRSLLIILTAMFLAMAGVARPSRPNG